MRGATDPYSLLKSLDSPADLRRLPLSRLPALAREVRAFLGHTVATPADHLAAGFATVELAIALHYVFDTPADRIVWDSGHQAWPHKLLTGRRERLHTIGQPGGLRPFPQRGESEYDAFGVGHCSTAIGAALGMAVAAARLGEQRRVVAVVGDGALTAGMAFEALNHGGSLPADVLVILNDNDPSAAANSSALSNRLARVLSGPVYARLRDRSKQVLRQMPTMRELARRSEQHLKGMVLPGTLFEELGFNYIGPLDGHNISALVATLQNLKRLRGPQFLHVLTRKGETALAAARRPHRPAPLAPADAAPLTGSPSGQASTRRLYSEVFGQWLCDIAEEDPDIIAITPAMREGSGLAEFAQRFPERYFDVSIAQQHAVTFAAGLAAEGFKPIVAISSTFLQRAYDQLIHDVALQRLPVVFAVNHAGLVGGDGATHHGSYDLSYLRCIPNLTIMAPADENECRQMLYTARALSGPAVVRYPCGHGPGVPVAAAMSVLPTGRAQVCREGRSGVALLVFGGLLDAAACAAGRLDATLVNMRFAKPLDGDLVAVLCARHQALVTIEENAIAGGAGTGVAEVLASRGLRIPLLQLGIPDGFIEQGSRESCLAAARLDASGLSNSVERWWLPRNPERLRAAAGG
jgi:1-deoxy-D-xylulose-5-phosphate synthase